MEAQIDDFFLLHVKELDSFFPGVELLAIGKIFPKDTGKYYQCIGISKDLTKLSSELAYIFLSRKASLHSTFWQQDLCLKCNKQ